MATPPPNCTSCGARVDAPQRDTAYTYFCRFCGAQIPIDSLRPVAPVAPRVEVRAPSRAPGPVQSRRARRGGCLVSAFTILPVLLAVGAALWPVLSKYLGAHYGDFPIEVPLNDSVVITDRTATGTGTLITVSPNGKLTLRRCHLKGPLVVKAGINAEITIIDSTLEGTNGVIEGAINASISIQNSTLTSNEEIVDGPSNVKVSVTNSSKLHAEGVALPLETNGEVTIDHSTVEGKMGGVELRQNGHLKANTAVITSDGVGIDLGLNGHLTVTASRIESKTTAIHAAQNLEGAVRTSTLIGPKASMDLGNNARLTVAQVTLNGPKHVGLNSTVDER
ncbi:MAG TPA: hypothetical protein VGI39_34830 [Polyangiaceae bacterium]|jgi:hypothetical protein